MGKTKEKNMIKLQIKNRCNDSVIFEYESETNTILETLLAAVKSSANLCGANLCGADLRGADLRDANLYGADLCGADLRGADLRDANLYGADLCGANLYDANLCSANLRGANLYGADLYSAKNAELVQATTIIVPEGEIIGWKRCRDDKIVKLLIPANAKRSNATGRKCRAEFAEVLAIYKKGSDKPYKKVIAKSSHDNAFTYKVGETVKPKEAFSDDRFDECASGIHFFITRLEAESY